jgi:hypothetical protein
MAILGFPRCAIALLLGVHCYSASCVKIQSFVLSLAYPKFLSISFSAFVHFVYGRKNSSAKKFEKIYCLFFQAHVHFVHGRAGKIGERHF